MRLQETLESIGGSARADAAPDAAPAAVAFVRIRLWDLPLRIFHWSLLAAVATAIITGILGGDWMGVHNKAGLAIIGLIAFRLAWGFLGSTYARFSTFVPTPARLLAYLRGQWRGVGHNPLGAFSVLALLGLLAVQAVLGLFGNDDISFTGPFAHVVSEELSYKLTGWHHQLANALYGLLALHVAAIVFYVRIKKDNLVKPMVTGWKDVDASTPAPRRAGVGALFVSVVIALAATYGASGLWVHQEAAPSPAPSASTPTQEKPAAPAW